MGYRLSLLEGGTNSPDSHPELGRVWPLSKELVMTGNLTLTSGSMFAVVWRQQFTKNVNRIATNTRGTGAGATPTVGKMALYLLTPNFTAETWSASQVATTSNTTSLWASTFTPYDTAFSGGETVTLNAGSIYVAAALCVTAATAPVIYGYTSGSSGGPNSLMLPRGITITGLADLPSSFNQGTSNLNGQTNAIPAFWLRLA